MVAETTRRAYALRASMLRVCGGQRGVAGTVGRGASAPPASLCRSRPRSQAHRHPRSSPPPVLAWPGACRAQTSLAPARVTTNQDGGEPVANSHSVLASLALPRPTAARSLPLDLAPPRLADARRIHLVLARACTSLLRQLGCSVCSLLPGGLRHRHICTHYAHTPGYEHDNGWQKKEWRWGGCEPRHGTRWSRRGRWCIEATQWSRPVQDGKWCKSQSVCADKAGVTTRLLTCLPTALTLV